MEIQYRNIRLNSESKENLISDITIDLNNKKKTKKTRGTFQLKFKYNDDFDISSNQILKFARFSSDYYIIDAKRNRFSLYFGLKKINGTQLFLTEQEDYEREIQNSSEENYLLYCKISNEAPYSHIAFISDDYKFILIQECFVNSNNKLQITKLEDIKDEESLKGIATNS